MSRYKKRKILFVKLITFLFVIINIWASEVHAQLKAGEKLPALKLPSLKGEEIKFQDFQGKAIIIHLWECQ